MRPSAPPPLPEKLSKMVRGKIEIRRIDNATSRQVTFSKRRNGLLKKAYELSVLCDVDIAVIIFSPTGKIFEYASTSMGDILDRYNNFPEEQRQRSSRKLDNIDFLSKEVRRLRQDMERVHQDQRRLTGEDLAKMSVSDLEALETKLATGLLSVRKCREGMLRSEIKSLREQLYEAEKRAAATAANLAIQQSKSMTPVIHSGLSLGSVLGTTLAGSMSASLVGNEGLQASGTMGLDGTSGLAGLPMTLQLSRGDGGPGVVTSGFPPSSLPGIAASAGLCRYQDRDPSCTAEMHMTTFSMWRGEDGWSHPASHVGGQAPDGHGERGKGGGKHNHSQEQEDKKAKEDDDDDDDEEEDEAEGEGGGVGIPTWVGTSHHCFEVNDCQPNMTDLFCS